MTRARELLVFTGIALGLHLAMWISLSQTGSNASGSGGEATISLAGSTGEITELVNSWTQPVDVAVSVESLVSPTPPIENTEIHTAEQSEPPSVKPVELQTAALPDPSPQVDTQPALAQNPVSARTELPESIATPQETGSFDVPRNDQSATLPIKRAAPALLKPQSLPFTDPADPLPKADTKTEAIKAARAAPSTSLRPNSRPQQKPVQPAQPSRQAADPVQQPRLPAAQPSGAVAQTAAGNGSGENAGNTSVDRAATLSPGRRQSLMARWGAEIRNSVERRKRYPSGTNVNGSATIKIVIGRQGRLVRASLAGSSGDPALDTAALRAVQSANYPPAPKDLDAPQYTFNLPIRFKRN